MNPNLMKKAGNQLQFNFALNQVDPYESAKKVQRSSKVTRGRSKSKLFKIGKMLGKQNIKQICLLSFALKFRQNSILY